MLQKQSASYVGEFNEAFDLLGEREFRIDERFNKSFQQFTKKGEGSMGGVLRRIKVRLVDTAQVSRHSEKLNCSWNILGVFRIEERVDSFYDR